MKTNTPTPGHAMAGNDKPAAPVATEQAALLAPPRGRRTLHHAVVEVRPRQTVTVSVSFQLAPLEELDRNRKAGLMMLNFLDAEGSEIPPTHRLVRSSERYGHFAYVGVEDGSAEGQMKLALSVPAKATKLVATVLPFSNPSLSLNTCTVALDSP